MDADVRGGEAFFKLSKAMKAAGATELRKELNKNLRDAAKPLIPLTRAEARRRLPRAGGLAERVARNPQRVQVRTGAKTAGVRIAVSKAGSGARALNAGQVRHPVFGTDRWVTQDVPEAEGWFDDTLNEEAPRVALPAVREAIETMTEKFRREVR